MGSLQDQLLEAGLATPEQLRKARAEQRREQRREPRGKRDAPDGARPPGTRPPKRRRAAPDSRAEAPVGDEGRREGRGHPARREPGTDRQRRGAPRRAAGYRKPESPGGPRPAEAPTGDDPSVPVLNLRIRELLDRHAVNDRNAEIAFNFKRENTVRRVYVTDEQRRRLAGGEIAIVGFRRRHHLVPAEVADEIQALRPIVFVHRAAVSGIDAAASDAVPEDDPYRDFPVPDDLHW